MRWSAARLAGATTRLGFRRRGDLKETDFFKLAREIAPERRSAISANLTQRGDLRGQLTIGLPARTRPGKRAFRRCVKNFRQMSSAYRDVEHAIGGIEAALADT
jgi:hypothetical protein